MNCRKAGPCPKCGFDCYEYGFSSIRLWSETAVVATGLFTGGSSVVVAGSALAKIISNKGAGLGPLSGLVKIYQCLIEGIKENPLLRCVHCESYIIVCVNCGRHLVLPNMPMTAEIIMCPNCYTKFGWCERSTEFDELLGITR
jgi:DNA-directed RNA polymerase subunit RPC12/RpoP